MNEDRTTGTEPPAAPREPKVIKRYTNRKLYDTVESRYVTLDEIAEMIKAGAEVKIVDNRTKEDLTSVTLAQIIFEEEKKTSRMSLETLRDLIRHGGEMAQRIVEGTQAELRGRVEAVRAGRLEPEASMTARTSSIRSSSVTCGFRRSGKAPATAIAKRPNRPTGRDCRKPSRATSTGTSAWVIASIFHPRLGHDPKSPFWRVWLTFYH